MVPLICCLRGVRRLIGKDMAQGGSQQDAISRLRDGRKQRTIINALEEQHDTPINTLVEKPSSWNDAALNRKYYRQSFGALCPGVLSTCQGKCLRQRACTSRCDLPGNNTIITGNYWPFSRITSVSVKRNCLTAS